jgi:hypothetical protein
MTIETTSTAGRSRAIGLSLDAGGSLRWIENPVREKLNKIKHGPIGDRH